MTASSSRNALPPGHRVHWYEIRRVLGRGGFGITYLADDENLKRQVAIKEYLPHGLAAREQDDSVSPFSHEAGAEYQQGLERFMAEARTLAQLHHPNIVRVFTVFEANKTAYMVMEYEQGESLHTVLTRRRTLPEAEIVRLLAPLLGGLEQVHAAGFVHRDIKPANIFLRADGGPVLLDFGSARQAIAGETRTLTSMVSPGYAPFEQYVAKSDKQGPWTDIYGLGATLYRVVTGRAPADAVERSQALLHNEPDTYVAAGSQTGGAYSRRLLVAIDHALSFKHQERPPSIPVWRQELGLGLHTTPEPELMTRGKPVLEGVRETATVVASKARGVPRAGVRRRRMLWPVVSAVAVLAVVLAINRHQTMHSTAPLTRLVGATVMPTVTESSSHEANSSAASPTAEKGTLQRPARLEDKIRGDFAKQESRLHDRAERVARLATDARQAMRRQDFVTARSDLDAALKLAPNSTRLQIARERLGDLENRADGSAQH